MKRKSAHELAVELKELDERCGIATPLLLFEPRALPSPVQGPPLCVSTRSAELAQEWGRVGSAAICACRVRLSAAVGLLVILRHLRSFDGLADVLVREHLPALAQACQT